MTQRSIAVLAALAALLLTAAPAGAQTLVQDVARKCQVEIKTYCSQVLPGGGRILACFYAHGDKLSPQCEYALFDASARLERAIAAITYVANECEDEIDEYCANIQPGGGNIAQCLLANDSNLGKHCSHALSDVGVK
ncbi:MAG: hypothetical protein AAF495_29460 [Pseudomonadota bacterium]